jgi:hypothetical protein
LADRFIFGVAPIDYGPVLLLMPFGFHLAMDTLPSGVLQIPRPARSYSRFRIWRPSSERQRDLNPPEQRAAQHALRASPPSHTARPVSRELPVDPHRDHRWDFPCCAWSTLPTCRRQYPGRSDGSLFAHTFHPLRPSPKPGRVGSCITIFGACSAFTYVTACMLARSPSRPSAPEASAVSLPPLLL